jgi:hypothetical protein
MDSQYLFEKIKAAAIEMSRQDEFGALHIVVANGNCEDEHVQFCLDQPNITAGEQAFARILLDEFTEEERFAVYAFSSCEDIRRTAEA